MRAAGGVLALLLGGCSLIVPGPDDFTYTDGDDAGRRDGGADAGADAGVDGGGDDAGLDAGEDAGASCAATETVCGGACTDTDTDPAHCGACDNACGAGWECRAGSCYDTPVEIAVGMRHSCVRRASGSVWCWGGNFYGELGTGTSMPSLVPAPVLGLAGAAHLSGSSALTINRIGNLSEFGYNCVATSSGQVSCWGSDGSGQIGDGLMDSAARPTPLPIPTLTNATDLALGGAHACATLAASPRTLCWGERLGALGTYDLTPRAVPGAPAGARYRGLAVGVAVACVIDGTGQLYCWGSNSGGAVGDGTMIDREAATPVVGLPPVVDVATGWLTACALEAGGQVWCWGADQLGDGSTSGSITPVRSSLSDAEALWAGPLYSALQGGDQICARRVGGSIECWGLDGAESQRTRSRVLRATPVPLGFWDGARSLAISLVHMCAITAAGDVECVGANTYGQLGDGTTTTTATPVPVRLP